jgi:hypothetical protein
MRTFLHVLLPEELLEFGDVKFLFTLLWHPRGQIFHELMQASADKLTGEAVLKILTKSYIDMWGRCLIRLLFKF